MRSSITVGENTDRNYIGDVSLRIGDKMLSRIMIGNAIIHDVPSKPTVLSSKIMHPDSVKPLIAILFLQNINGSPIIKHALHIGDSTIMSIADPDKYDQRYFYQNDINNGVYYEDGLKPQFAVFDAKSIDKNTNMTISSYNKIGQSLRSDVFNAEKNSDTILFYDPLTSFHIIAY